MTSPLLCLPSELRISIFEYVLCGKTIHIGTRRPRVGETGGCPRLPGEPHIKLMHAVCSCSRAWQEAYEMSKTSDAALQPNLDERGFLKRTGFSGPEVLQSYYLDHRNCNSVLNDFHWRDYATFPDRHCRCPFPCFHYFEYRRKAIREFGEPPQGLQLKHRASRFDAALLSTCRVIYNDCALLPYSGNTFAFQNRLDLDLFLDKSLTLSQRNAIRSMNICVRSLINPTLPQTIPENLEVLECFIVNDDGNFWEVIGPWKGRFSNVQVISGWDGRRSTFEDGRLVRREKAEKLESFLKTPD